MTEESKARLPLGKRAAFVLLGLAAALLLGAALWLGQSRVQEHRLETFAMGSYVRQTVWGGDGAAAAANEAINRLEEQISWRRDGDVAKVNRAAGRPVEISRETGTLLEEALALCGQSGGAFDVTLGSVTRLWDFDSNPHLPDEAQLREALALAGYAKLSLNREEYLDPVPNEDGSHTDSLGVWYQASLPEGMALDLGAIGKGAACDVAVECCSQAGAAGAVIAVGGSIGLYGQKPDGQPWRVSVRDPAGEGTLGVLELPGGFVSTSGSYEKFFEQDGKTYCHLLDPRTGYPAESGLVSVTVWCPPDVGADWPGALSDGLATACFVLGLEDGQTLLEQYGTQAVLVDDANHVYVTGGLQERFTLTASGYSMVEESA